MRNDRTVSGQGDTPELQECAIFEALRALSPEQREPRLAKACGEDIPLRRRVEALLAAHDSEFLARPTVSSPDAGEATSPTAPDLIANGPGRMVGPYRLLQVLGEGGFGTVFMAEQQRPVHRRVALKILKAGMDTRQVVARFEAERQALALMDHPNIAKVFDAGTTQSGRPYFVMELVHGIPVTKYCDQNRLTVQQRLELFITVCQAVQHAHQKAIIHRDIKPTNILVELIDGRPLVKVIDFGVAKAITQHLTERTLFTELGQLIGTPEYMSPEQAEMSSMDIDTRTDIYSLGVVLYELLAGALPFDPKALRSEGYAAIQRIIREVDPPRPSTRLSSLGDSAAEVARRRQMRVEQLTRQLRGELEWIPLKAIRKERDRRYASPLQLAEDIQNYLNHKPLLAGPESRTYRLRKFARRNRGPIAAAVALVLVLVLGVITTSVMYVRAERERKEAQRQKEIAQARFDDVRALANSFLFEVHDQIENLAGATPARQKLVQTALQYLNKLSRDAGSDRALLQEIAIAYDRIGDVQGNPHNSNLGDTQGALSNYRKELSITQKLADSDPTDSTTQRNLTVCLSKIGDILSTTGDNRGALECYRQSLDVRLRLAAAHPGSALMQGDLSSVYTAIGNMLLATGDASGAISSYTTSLEILQRIADADPKNPAARDDLSNSYDKIGNVLADNGSTHAALEKYRLSLEIRQKLADGNPTNANAQRSLSISHEKIGDIMNTLGDVPGAMKSYAKAKEIAQQLADSDRTNASAQDDLAILEYKIGDVQMLGSSDAPTALEAYRKSLAIYSRLAASDPANTANQRGLALVYSRIGFALTATGDNAKALDACRKALAIEESLSAADPSDIKSQRGLADCHCQIGDVLNASNVLSEAETEHQKALMIRQQLADKYPTDRAAQRDLEISLQRVGDLLALRGDLAGALQRYSQSLTITQNLATTNPSDSQLQRDLWVGFSKMAGSYEMMALDISRPPHDQMQLWQQAKSWYTREIKQANLMKQMKILSPADEEASNERRSTIKRCDAAIAELSGVTTRPATSQTTSGAN